MLISTPTYKTFIMMYKVYLPFKQIIFEQLGGVSSLHTLQNIFIAFTKYKIYIFVLLATLNGLCVECVFYI